MSLETSRKLPNWCFPIQPLNSCWYFFLDTAGFQKPEVSTRMERIGKHNHPPNHSNLSGHPVKDRDLKDIQVWVDDGWSWLIMANDDWCNFDIWCSEFSSRFCMGYLLDFCNHRFGTVCGIVFLWVNFCLAFRAKSEICMISLLSLTSNSEHASYGLSKWRFSTLVPFLTGDLVQLMQI